MPLAIDATIGFDTENASTLTGGVHMTRPIGTFALLVPLTTALLVTGAAAQLAPIPIAPGETVNGVLYGKDATLNDGSFYECYALTGTPGSSVLLTLRSTEFDTYLLLISSSLPHCADVPDDAIGLEDDDGGGGPNGTDSQLTLTFDANGRFLIAATSYAAGMTGAYTLTAEAIAAAGGKGPGVAAPAPAAASK
jgi:hypothetical protein